MTFRHGGGRTECDVGAGGVVDIMVRALRVASPDAPSARYSRFACHAPGGHAGLSWGQAVPAGQCVGRKA